MKPIGGSRVGHDTVPDRFTERSAGTSPRIENPELVRATVAAVEALGRWNAKLVSDLSDESMVRLEKELETGLSALFPSPDQRRRNGRKTDPDE